MHFPRGADYLLHLTQSLHSFWGFTSTKARRAGLRLTPLTSTLSPTPIQDSQALTMLSTRSRAIQLKGSAHSQSEPPL